MKIDSDSGDDPAAASNPLATYLQSKTEFEKQKLSRQLHDELGGLLVASLMDAAWVEQHLSGQPDEVMKKLQRVIHSIGAAIAMKRQIVEDLRPTLLDNVGLYAALGWLLRNSCSDARLRYREEFPPDEAKLGAKSAIALFRIVQDALHIIVRRQRATCVSLNARTAGALMVLELSHDGDLAISSDDWQASEFESMRNRIGALGGRFETARGPHGFTILRTLVPLEDRTQ